MDIMRPKLEQQVSPPPRIVARRAIRLPSLIRRLLRDSPDLGVDEIILRLKQLGVQASGVVVAMWLMNEPRRQAAAALRTVVAERQAKNTDFRKTPAKRGQASESREVVSA